MTAEFQRKQEILQKYLDQNGFDGMLLSLKSNEAWLSCGGSCWVGKDSPFGCADLLCLDKQFYALTAENEKARIRDEELSRLGFQVIAHPWYESRMNSFRALAQGRRIASDTGYAGTENRCAEITRLRYALSPEEIERARSLGADCARAMLETCNELMPGDTEHEVSALITGKLMRKGIQAPCCLVAADERIGLYRHPIPTFKQVQRQCMVVICGVRDGLVMSMSRIVSFGPISGDLEKRQFACAKIDARFWERTAIGANAVEAFRAGIEAYAEFGYPEDWKYHHQGGAIGYDSRDYTCTFETSEIIVANQMFAWNPTVTGTKMEDTFLLTEHGREVFTEIPDWPVIKVETSVGTIRRPRILIR